MGMDAELYAIGRISESVIECLDYNRGLYENTPVGSTIMTKVITCTTTDASITLATALGIAPWKFEQHCDIDVSNADIELLYEAAEVERQVQSFFVLRANGFKFFYLPNG